MSTGTYIACKFSADTRRKLSEWADFLQIPNRVLPHEYHATILYSRKELKKEDQVNMNADQLGKLGWVFLPTKLDLFPTRKDDRSCLVVRLIAPQLTALHQSLIAKGGTHDFDTYDVHVTISQDVPSDINLGKLYPPSLHFIPTQIYSEKLDLS